MSYNINRVRNYIYNLSFNFSGRGTLLAKTMVDGATKFLRNDRVQEIAALVSPPKGGPTTW